MLDVATLFAPDYATSRQRFREAAAALGLALEAHPINQSGPAGEDLTIDIAISPGRGSNSTLVISSGLHGVEGYFGAAVQLALLRAWNARRETLPAVRCVFLHALNPYGFAWRRRVNEDNVDLNRNLLREGEAFSGSPDGYAALNSLLNPKHAPRRGELVTLKLLEAIAHYGMPALIQAIASGQYDYPQGLFYGGNQPSRTNHILSAHFDRWLGGSKHVMHLDFHTGLGRRGTCKLLLDCVLSEAQYERLNRWWGRDSFARADGPDVTYSTRGSFGLWADSRNRDCDYIYACAEFGTYNLLRVLKGLRAENQSHHWSAPGSLAMERTRQQLLELFCPRSERWRKTVLRKGIALAHQSINALLELTPPNS